MLESIFAKESLQSLPLGGRTVRGTVRSGPGEATINHRWPGEAGSDEGATLYPTFPCRSRKGGFRLSPQRNASPAPLGNPVAPSSVTSGDSFPPRGSLWVVQPYPKKRPKSGHVHGHRNSPTTAPLRPTTPKPASGNERAIKKGGRGPSPATLCVRAFSRESLDPPPGTGRETTSQVLTCDGPEGAPCRQQHARAAPGSLQTKREGPKAFPFLPSRVMLWLPSFACRCRRCRWGWSQSPAFRRRAPSLWPPPGRT